MFRLTLSSVFFLPGCSGFGAKTPAASATSTASSAVGRWNSSDETRWVELTSKGTVAVVSREQALVGTYTAKGDEVTPVFVALNSSKRSHSAGVWKMRLDKDKLQVTNPDKQSFEYQRADADPQLQESPILGRWEWTRKGTTKPNYLEFTPWGSFVSVRWLHPKEEKAPKGKGKRGVAKGELEELREAGDFRLEGKSIYLTTFRRKKSNRKLQFELVTGIEHDKLIITHTRPDGTVASAEYKRSL